MSRYNLLPLVALLAFPVFVSAQFGETVEVNYIEVPVTVLGRDDAPVRGLTKANFEVIEEGQKREIESFDAIDFTSPETLRSVSPLNPASRRNFLLLFDLSFSAPNSLQRAQEAARDFVARSVGKRDLVGIATVDVDRGFRYLTSFTTDRNIVAAAIRDPRNFRAFDPLQIAGNTHQALFDMGPSHESTAQTQIANDPAAEVAADLKRSVRAADDAYRRGRLQKQVELIASVAKTLRSLAGRKHVVLLSEGFDPRLVQGRSVSDTLEQQEENTAVASGEVWKVDSDKRFGHTGAQRSIRDMAEEFRRADAVLHAVDIQGVRVQNDIRTGARVNTNEGLFLVAGATGGEVFRNSNDITADFDRLLRQQEVIYVLGFRAPAGKAGQFRDLNVKLVNVPGGRVSHRDGYYAGGPETNVERSLSTAEIIVNDIGVDDLDIAALASPFPTPDGNAQVPVILEISGPDLIAAARNNTATADIFVYAFDDEGIVRDTIYQRMQLDTAKAGDKLRAAGVKFYGTLNLSPGRYAIKTLVRVGESDSKSFQRIELEVPREGDVLVSQPLFFADAGEWVMIKAEPRQKTGAPYPFVLNGQSFIPAARPTLRNGAPQQFTVWVWNANRDELELETTPPAKLVSETDGTNLTKFVFALDNVPPGTSQLAVTVRKKGGTEERKVRAEVRTN